MPVLWGVEGLVSVVTFGPGTSVVEGQTNRQTNEERGQKATGIVVFINKGGLWAIYGGGGTPGPEAYLSEESDLLVLSQSYNILGFIFVESKNTEYDRPQSYTLSQLGPILHFLTGI